MTSTTAQEIAEIDALLKKHPEAKTLRIYIGRGEYFDFPITNHPKEESLHSNTGVCPPHSFIPYAFEGAWGGSVPPPNMKCTKCLHTEHF